MHWLTRSLLPDALFANRPAQELAGTVWLSCRSQDLRADILVEEGAIRLIHFDRAPISRDEVVEVRKSYLFAELLNPHDPDWLDQSAEFLPLVSDIYPVGRKTGFLMPRSEARIDHWLLRTANGLSPLGLRDLLFGTDGFRVGEAAFRGTAARELVWPNENHQSVAERDDTLLALCYRSQDPSAWWIVDEPAASHKPAGTDLATAMTSFFQRSEAITNELRELRSKQN